ncbi:hypothetical protein N657DRAFT_693864 [Parathielavia appendiculata]|uniref:Uncharacterized protein n=1 Tax=Parathielavia appendiculata TaxID=2587402 RepID=A0AAN6TRB5_9PEZI|nr:hypothetical protein N657DRAFT_693864 [Parathielavia appendiculata]
MSTKAVADALKDGNIKYAIVGGASRLLLAQPEHFSVDARTNHTVYLSTPPVGIQIIAPPALFREPFDESTEPSS